MPSAERRALRRYAPELDAHLAADQGASVVGGFRADQPGRYMKYCSTLGDRDAGMEARWWWRPER
jgi:hypothetical protein